MVDPPSREVIPLLSKDYAAAGGLLGRAFSEDPLWLALISDPQTRQAKLARMFTGLVRTTAATRGVLETTPGLGGVAVWFPPGERIGWWPMVRSGMAMPRAVMRLPAQDRRRLIDVLRQTEQRRAELMTVPHWYLEAVGVEPERQGEGLGSALVRAGIARADRDKTPVYLETETEGNVGYYERLGFGVVDQIVATGLDLPLWIMTRP